MGKVPTNEGRRAAEFARKHAEAKELMRKIRIRLSAEKAMAAAC